MARQDWHTRMIAPARDRDGHATQVICGVVQWHGERRIALSAGRGELVILADGGARELIAHLYTTIEERRRR